MFYGKHEMKTGLRKRYIVLIAILSLIAVMVIGFLGWTAFFYKADDTARAFLTSDTTLQEKGNLTILPEAGSAADEVMQAYPDIRIWYMSGHSLGGAMAGRYAGRHADRIRGLILMGAYIYGDYPASGTLTLYGSLDTLARDRITYTENVICIEGGNHAQFGNYGRQKGDSDAAISREDQQAQAVRAITKFIE
jgi:pimeloyl-ACP methyl ester carboxylesterase